MSLDLALKILFTNYNIFHIFQLSQLCKKLDEIWEENQGEVVLFNWTNFLREESFTFLNLTSPLDLSNVIISRTSTTDMEEDVIIVYKKRVTEAELEQCDSRAIQDIASQDLLLTTLLEYDNAQTEHEFQTTVYTCNVCFNEKLGAACIKFTPCDHVFCKECMKGYFEVQIADGSVKCLTCPQEDCESQGHPAQVLLCNYWKPLFRWYKTIFCTT